LSGAAALSLIAAAPASAALPKDFAAKADKLVAQSWAADGPGAAVIVTDHGKIVYQSQRGLADIEAKTPIRPDTVFRLGSITKQFSASVLLQLVSEGKLSLDDKLSKFYPGYPEPGGNATVRQLLNHTSGIMSYTSIPGWMVEENTNKPHTTDQLVAVFRDLPSPSKPGEKWDYNNSGYILIGGIIEKVTGKPWPDAVAERIAVPLHLGTLKYGVGEEQVPGMAKGYSQAEGGKFQLSTKIHMSVPGAAGALIGSAPDLAAWANALHHGKVVPPALYTAMTTPAKLNDGKTEAYGFGLRMGDIRGHRTIEHGGGIFGFTTASFYLPDEDLFVAVLGNSGPPIVSPDFVAKKLAALAIGDPYPQFAKRPIDMTAVKPFLGAYAVEGSDQPRVFYAEKGQLFTRRADGRPMEVHSAGANRYFYGGDVFDWFEVKTVGGKKVMEMHADGGPKAERAVRTGPVPQPEKPADVPVEVLKSYVGSYKVGPAAAVVTLVDGGLVVKLGDQPTLKLIPRAGNEFEVESAGARLVFNSTNGAPPSSMTIKQEGRSMEAPRIP
jgi:CubicO group peptidase (beta-lactamase class C family)